MRKIFFLALSVFVILDIFQQTGFSQMNCSGEKIFSEKRCAGDEISAQENDLYRIVNDYRAQNNLPQIPISEPLSLVANRHLLDLIFNVKSFTHGWSNCAYEVGDQKTWDCVFESPKRLNSGYVGKGYENLYRTKTGSASAVLALESWKKSDLHNSLILNLKTFKDIKFDAFGVAINGQYAALWFGSNPSAVNGEVKKTTLSSLGVGMSFEKIVSGFSGIIAAERSSNFVSGKWSGISNDKSLMIQLNGVRDNISEATISLKPEKNNQLSQKQKEFLVIFLNCTAEDWSNRVSWLTGALNLVQQNPKMSQTITHKGKAFVLVMDSQSNYTLTVKPSVKPTARQL